MTGTEQAFDSYSEKYDAHFTETHTGWLQRKRVWKNLSRFSPNEFPNLLELNCGTGEDAVWLAKRGFNVSATDLSEGMVQVTKAKAAKANLNLTAKKTDMREIASAFPGQKFNLIFSDFGGLNCLSQEELKILASDLSKLLLPNGKLVFVIMGRKCRWERFYFKRKGEIEKASRRMKNEPVTAEINGNTFPVWYYSPEEFAGFFASEFSVVRKKPIGLFLPPSYLDSWFRKKKRLLSLLNFCEYLFSFSFWSDKADHYLIEMDRRK